MLALLVAFCCICGVSAKGGAEMARTAQLTSLGEKCAAVADGVLSAVPHFVRASFSKGVGAHIPPNAVEDICQRGISVYANCWKNASFVACIETLYTHGRTLVEATKDLRTTARGKMREFLGPEVTDAVSPVVRLIERHAEEQLSDALFFLSEVWSLYTRGESHGFIAFFNALLEAVLNYPSCALSIPASILEAWLLADALRCITSVIWSLATLLLSLMLTCVQFFSPDVDAALIAVEKLQRVARVAGYLHRRCAVLIESANSLRFRSGQEVEEVLLRQHQRKKDPTPSISQCGASISKLPGPTSGGVKKVGRSWKRPQDRSRNGFSPTSSGLCQNKDKPLLLREWRTRHRRLT